MGKELIYCLFECKDTKQLVIGSTESISIPRGFNIRTLMENLTLLAKFIDEKTEIGINVPVDGNKKQSLPKKSNKPEIEAILVSARLISFSEDKDSIVAERDAIVDSRKPKAKPTVTNSYKTKCTTTQSLADKGTSRNVVVTKPLPTVVSAKGLPVSIPPNSSVGLVPAKQVAVQKPLPTAVPIKDLRPPNSSVGLVPAKKVAVHKPLAAAVPIKDMMPPKPTDADYYPSGDDYNSQSNDSDIVESSDDESHTNKFIPITDIPKSFVANKTPPAQWLPHHVLTPEDSRSSSPNSAANSRSSRNSTAKRSLGDEFEGGSSSSSSPSNSSSNKKQRIEQHNQKLEKMKLEQERMQQQLLILENEADSQDMFEKEPVDYKEQITGLKLEIATLKEKIAEKDKMIEFKDAEILTLLDTPDAMAKNLKDGLVIIQNLLKQQQASPIVAACQVSSPAAAAATSKMIKLVDEYEVFIPKTSLRTAISYGKNGKEQEHLNKLVAHIMKGIWDRKYMAGRSVSGRACPTDKIRKNVKPGLPKEELNAIIDYAISFWKSQHKFDINQKAVKSAITTKLLPEHTAQLKQDGKLAKAATQVEADQPQLDFELMDQPDQHIEFELIDDQMIIDDLCNESAAAI